MSEKQKLQFTPEQKSSTLEFANGEYSRRFDAKDQPFECDEEEAAMLLRSGHFVAAEGKEQAVKGPEADLKAETPKPSVASKIGG